MNAEVLVPLFLLFLASMPLLAISLPMLIDDWLRAREERNKSAVDGASSPAHPAAA